MSTTTRWWSGRRTARTLVAVGLLALLWTFLGPAQLGGPATYVTTRGSSMAPKLVSGDLVVLRPAETLRVGDVAAYRSELFDTVVLHRIVGAAGGRYSFQGDRNPFLDPEEPTAVQVIGKEVLRIPDGGAWMRRLSSPAALGLYAFLFVAGGGAAVNRNHRRRRRRRTAMTPTPRRQRVIDPITTLTPPLRVAAAVTAALLLLVLALSAVAWTAPVRALAVTDAPSPGRMDFAYSSPVRRSAAYDGTRAASPDPIFRRLIDTVDVDFTYRGQPGRIAMDAVLSTSSGWSTTIPLQPETAFTTPTYDGSTRLDLSALQARADAAATATGLPAGQVLVTLAPTVTSTTGATFSPTLALTLDPLVLSLTGDPSSLVVLDASTASSRTEVPRTLSALGVQVAVPTARLLLLVALLVTSSVAAAIVMAARRTRPSGEGEGIRRRWSSVLVEVYPVSVPRGHRIVDVTEPVTLVRLAERLGLLVMHWAEGDVETFVVQDDATTYRYRAAAHQPVTPSTPVMAGATGAAR